MARSNNFDAIRMVAAVAVLVSHSLPIAHGRATLEPLAEMSHGQTNLGRLAVAVFFIISGYLITASFERRPRAGAFARARLLRIMPALAAMLVVVTFILGPLVSRFDPWSYLTSAQTWRYLLGSVSFTLGGKGHLPGVFAETPLPDVVNGSLWTLRYEMECYALVLLLGVAGLLRGWVVLLLLGLALAAIGFAGGGHRATFMAYFLGGAALHCVRVPLRSDVAGVCTAIWAAALVLGGWRYATATAGAYVVIWAGAGGAFRLPPLARWGDLSYGTYLWAFPVQQTVALLLGATVTWQLNVALSLPVVLGLAWLSWRLVEAPALRLKGRAMVGLAGFEPTTP